MIELIDDKSVVTASSEEETEENEQLEQQEQAELEENDELIEGAAAKDPHNRRDVRALAFHYVYAIDRHDYTVSLEELVSQYEIHFGVSAEEAAFSLDLAKGAIENREALDEQIKPLLENWKLERLGCCTRLILRMALWELQQPEAVPSIVINEAVELAKGFAEKDSYKFVNGILDEARKKSEIKENDDATTADTE
jgi:N utilization substance protein B